MKASTDVLRDFARKRGWSSRQLVCMSKTILLEEMASHLSSVNFTSGKSCKPSAERGRTSQ